MSAFPLCGFRHIPSLSGPQDFLREIDLLHVEFGSGGGASAKAAWPAASLLPSPGPTSQQPCAQGPSDCGKQCEPDYYRDGDGRCKACVTCSGGKGLVVPSRGSFLGVGGLGQESGVGNPEFVLGLLSPREPSSPRWHL